MLDSLNTPALRADHALAVARDTFLKGVTGGVVMVAACHSCGLYKPCMYAERYGRLCCHCYCSAVVDGVTLATEAERDERLHKADEPARVRRA